MVHYGDGVGNAIENLSVFSLIIIIIIIIRKFVTRTCSQALSMNRRRGQSNLNMLVAVSKGMLAVKLYSNKILH